MLWTTYNLYLIGAYLDDGEPYVKLGYSNKISETLYDLYAANPDLYLVGVFYTTDVNGLNKRFSKCVHADKPNGWYSFDQLELILGILGSNELN